MDEQAKLKRLLSLILILLGPRHYTVKELQERLDLSERSVFRYIKLLRDTGIFVEQLDGYYHIIKIEPNLKELSELLHFSEEEAVILNTAILAIDDNNQLKTNLIKKLYSIYDFNRIPETICRPKQAKNIQQIIKGIDEQKQIVLNHYQSAHSQKIENRQLEAFDFTFNYQMIWAYDINDKCNKQFKVSRIESVSLLDKPWGYRDRHKKMANDAFRMSGDKAEDCELILSLRAGNLLIEEYPLAEINLFQGKNDKYIFKDKIFGYYGVGRFCLGLIDEIDIIKPQGLKKYIFKKIKYFQERKGTDSSWQ